MIPPGIPPSETDRLRALRELRLLDTPAEERFDRITRLAQALFDVPIALVSLVDADRQWFKSRQGLAAEETSREISFCGHAIRGDELFIVPDATRDERFADNPLVSGPPNIRFYAGAPLSAPGGQKIGTLCLIDRRPRDLTPAQRQALRDLADVAEAEIAGAAEPAAPEAPPAGWSPASRKVLAAFVAALAVLVVFSATSYRSARRFIENSRQVAHTQEVLRSLERVDALAAQEESAARGYEISRDAKLLSPYFEATGKMSAQIAELRRLTEDNASQQKRLDDVGTLAGWQNAFAERVMRGGSRAPAASLSSGDSARVMGKLRTTIGEMKDEERLLLEERSARAAADADRLTGLLIGAGVARAAVVLLALLALLRGLAATGKTEQALRRTRDRALKAAEGRLVAQAEAERLGERLRAVLDHIDVGVTVVEAGGGASVYNRAAERIHGAWRDQMDRLFRAGTHPPMREDEKTAFAPGEDPLGQALKGETVRDARVFFRTPFRPNGYHLSVNAIPLRDPRGLLTGAVLIFTERKPEAP